MTTTLERITTVPDSESDLDAELHQRAKDLLGYSAGLDELAKAAELRRVIAACDELGIERPFTEESVERYKAGMVFEVNAIASSAALALVLIGSVFFFLGVVCFSVDGIRSFLGHALESREVWASATILGIGVFFLVFGGCACLLWKVYKRETEWQRLLLTKDRRRNVFGDALPDANSERTPIPEFALQTACDMKEKLPDFAFGIDVLREKQRPVYLDPFLFAQGKHGTYYLEVWNEPGFKRERMS